MPLGGKPHSLAVISLTNGGVALCDPDDEPMLNGYRWSGYLIYKRMYAMTEVDRKRVYMHRMLLPEAKEVDHINRDGLDNRRENLRSCTHSQNIANSEFKPNISGYRGVSQNHKRWRAKIKVHGREIYLGNYVTPEEAARVYDEHARLFFGEFAFQNFP